MDDSGFWGLIDSIDQSLLDQGDDGGAVESLVDALSRLQVSDHEDFEERLARALFALDGRAYAENAGESGRSDDAFLYARCWVVAHGRRHYEAVLADPGRMPRALEEWCEPLLSAAADAWARSTGGEPDEFHVETSVSYETGSNAPAWEPGD